MDTSVAAPVAHRPASRGALRVLTITGASVLAGVGLFGTFYWLVTLRWLYFASLAPLVVGAYLLFTRATGPDRA
jgi:hypothetical protein